MSVHNNFARFLLSGQGTGVSAFHNGGSGVDIRASRNYGYLQFASYSPSAILFLQASYDNTGWVTVATVTATPTSGFSAVGIYLPYVRGAYSTGWSTTASAVMHYSPGVL